MRGQVHLSTKLLVKTALRLHTIILKEAGNSVCITGSDSKVELLEPFTRDVFGRDSGLRRCFRRLVDRGVGQFTGPEVLLEDGSHYYEVVDRERRAGRRDSGAEVGKLREAVG
jgi:hypothetical protein